MNIYHLFTPPSMVYVLAWISPIHSCHIYQPLVKYTKYMKQRTFLANCMIDTFLRQFSPRNTIM